MEINSIPQPVRTPAFIRFAIIMMMALLLSLIATVFHLADFGNVQTGLFWMVSILAPATVVGLTLGHHYEGELTREASRSRTLHGRGWDAGYEEGAYQAYLTMEIWGGSHYENFEEFRGHLEEFNA